LNWPSKLRGISCVADFQLSACPVPFLGLGIHYGICDRFITGILPCLLL
jgi:hypothetical protein